MNKRKAAERNRQIQQRYRKLKQQYPDTGYLDCGEDYQGEVAGGLSDESVRKIARE